MDHHAKQTTPSSPPTASAVQFLESLVYSLDVVLRSEGKRVISAEAYANVQDYPCSPNLAEGFAELMRSGTGINGVYNLVGLAKTQGIVQLKSLGCRSGQVEGLSTITIEAWLVPTETIDLESLLKATPQRTIASVNDYRINIRRVGEPLSMAKELLGEALDDVHQ
jgi:hypothetical protein